MLTLLSVVAMTCAGILTLKTLKLVNIHCDLINRMQLDYAQLQQEYVNARIAEERVDEEDYVQERALYAYCERLGDGSVKVILNTTSHSIIVCEYDSKDKVLNIHCADELCDSINFAIREKMEGDTEDEDDDDLLEDDPEDDNEQEH